MKVGKEEQIAGLPIMKMRDALRKLKDSKFDAQDLAHELSISSDEADVVIGDLAKQGLVEPASVTPTGEKCFETTILGNQLANARFVARMPRAKAEKVLKEVLARVQQINKNPDFTHSINELRVFGSYMSGAETLGDLDIAVKVEMRPGITNEQLLARANASGKSFSNFVMRLTYGDTEVRQYLKRRSPYIALHDLDELAQLGCDSVVLYPPGVPTSGD